MRTCVDSANQALEGLSALADYFFGKNLNFVEIAGLELIRGVFVYFLRLLNEVWVGSFGNGVKFSIAKTSTRPPS